MLRRCCSNTPHDIDSIDRLDLGTHIYAAPAEYTFVRVAYQGQRCVVDWQPLCAGSRKLHFSHPQLRRQLTKITVLAPLTRKAILWVIGQQQLDIELAGLADARSIGPDLHALIDLHNTCALEVASTLYLDDTDSACTFLADSLKIAESRHVNLCIVPGSLQDCRPVRYLVVPSIDFQVQHSRLHEVPPGQLLFADRTKTTNFIAGTTLDALALVDYVNFLDLTCNSLY